MSQEGELVLVYDEEVVGIDRESEGRHFQLAQEDLALILPTEQVHVFHSTD